MSEHDNGESEGERNDNITEVLGTNSGESTSPNENADGVGGPEEQQDRGGGPGLFVIGVGEEDRGKQGERFEDVGLEDWNADMTENDVCKVCQANGKGGPEKDLCSSGTKVDLWRGVVS